MSFQKITGNLGRQSHENELYNSVFNGFNVYFVFQGGSFVESYTPTDEINVTSIQWNYKATDDIVKVEVWDVVDKGKKRAQLSGLKIQDTKIPNIEQPALDAEFVDVFKGAHGVIIMFDVTKAWTFDYVKREAPKVPKQIPLLILANFIDQVHSWDFFRQNAMFVLQITD